MNRKIVGMISSYSALDKRPDWLWHQTPYHFGNWGNIQMLAQAPTPDFLLMYNYTIFPEFTEKKLFFWQNKRAKNNYEAAQKELVSKLRGVPKERIIYLLREPPLDEVVEANKRFYWQAQDYCSYISGPDDFAPTPDYMPAIWYHSNSFRDLHDLPSPEKVAACSWITSGISRTANHRQRMAFLKQLQNSDFKFDLYGRDLPSWARTRGQIGSKWSGMAPYYYNLAIENYADNDWYVSEKLWDALLAWCLPIYYGGSAADKLLPNGSFLRLPSLDEKGIAYIQEITATPDAWYAAKDAIAEARQVILHKLNLLEWLSNYVKKFG